MKKSRKLILHRETLHSMELRGVAGADFAPSQYCTTACQRTTVCDGEETYGYCPNTYENCSVQPYCQTGGACSTSGSCMEV
ncbi:MAG TPA: hypothetical protein VEO54_27015 [Thermoanaerobaculia bacterium]|nr:hypothetical protein [Thermoanaerobaculia bacterium]